MFLTKAALNPARRGTGRLLASPQALHAAVLAGFPPDSSGPTTDGRVLWRIDREHPHLWLYIVSPERPDLTHLIEQAGWPTTATWDTRDYTPLLARVAAGQRYAFRLTANPVKQSREPDHAGKRLGHVTAEQQRDWLLGRADNYGFGIPEPTAGEPDVIVSERIKRSFHRNGNTVTLVTARYDGRLEVTDADRFRHALTHGIGRAKGYGCGLLTVAAR